MTASEDVKASLKANLEALLCRGRELLGLAEEHFRNVQAQDDAWKAEYVRLHAASCRLPISEHSPKERFLGTVELAWIDSFR